MIVSLNEYAAGVALCAAAWITSSVLAVDQPAEQMGLPNCHSGSRSSTDDPQPLGHHARACHQWQGSRAGTLAAVLGSASMLPRSSTNSIPRSRMARTC